MSKLTHYKGDRGANNCCLVLYYVNIQYVYKESQLQSAGSH